MRQITPNKIVRVAGTVAYELPQGRTVLLDEQDVERTKHLRWQYGARGHITAHNKRATVYLARLILGVRKNDPVRVQYRNGDRSDCRRDNLFTIPWPRLP